MCGVWLRRAEHQNGTSHRRLVAERLLMDFVACDSPRAHDEDDAWSAAQDSVADLAAIDAERPRRERRHQLPVAEGSLNVEGSEDHHDPRSIHS